MSEDLMIIVKSQFLRLTWPVITFALDIDVLSMI